MKAMTYLRQHVTSGLAVSCIYFITTTLNAVPAAAPTLEAGFAVRDITPDQPIRLAGYASRDHAAEKADHLLLVQAVAWKDAAGSQFALVALDNCEVSRPFMAPVLREVEQKYGLSPGQMMVVSSHTHSAPILEDTLETMYQLSATEQENVRNYSRRLRQEIVAVVGAALADRQPVLMERGMGRATFAMNRRVYRDDRVVFGDNPDGPVDWDVPVLRISGTNGAVRAILFGYACHGTSVRGGDDFYLISGEYMAYARQHLEATHPGAMAIYVTGMGADSDPSPRGPLMAARRHGLELAGAVMGVLDRPMQPVQGPLRWVYEEVEMPLVDAPNRAQLTQDAQSKDMYIRKRAEKYLALLDQSQPLPASVKLPLAVVRFGDDLTMLAMGGEVVVDYALKFKRLYAADHPWMIGYAYEVPCYIPTLRIIKEGGYEAESSLIYYGYYGPFRGRVEDLLLQRMNGLVSQVRHSKP